MSRSLRVVLAALLMAAASPAFAGPDDPFPAASLSEFHRKLLPLLDDGRYSISGGRVLDRKAGGAALTNAQVERLLKLPASAAAASAPGGGRGEDGAAARARTLASGPRPGTPNFDGAAARKGTLPGPVVGTIDPAGPGRAPAQDKALLQSQLLRRLVVKGTPKEREILGRAIEAVLDTATGRELAAQFVSEKAAAEIVIGAIEGTEIKNEYGKRELSGSGGHTATNLDPPRVTLNRLYAELDPELSRVTMAGTLTHELFGHAFEAQRAKKAGLPFAVQYFYRGDEAGARLLDWTVQTELAGSVKDDDPDSYLGDPEGHFRAHWTVNEYYAVTLSPAEMRDPVPALRARLKIVGEQRAALAANRKLMSDWGVIRDHFVAKHGIARARFKPTDERIADYERYAIRELEDFDEIDEYLRQVIGNWSSPSGASELAQLKAGASSPYIKAAERRLAYRRTGLLRLRAAGRKPSSEEVRMLPPLVIIVPADPAKAPISLEELSDMYAEDLSAHPEHWNK